jgi:hypothetical protein
LGRAVEGQDLERKNDTLQIELLGTTATQDDHPIRTVAITAVEELDAALIG